MPVPQHFKSHIRHGPAYRFVGVSIVFAIIAMAIVWLSRHYRNNLGGGLRFIVMLVTLVVLAESIRFYRIVLRDRIIPLEERLRLASLLSPEALAEVRPLTTQQLIELRFASDAELPALALRSVRENLTAKQIKQIIVEWRADG